MAREGLSYVNNLKMYANLQQEGPACRLPNMLGVDLTYKIAQSNKRQAISDTGLQQCIYCPSI